MPTGVGGAGADAWQGLTSIQSSTSFGSDGLDEREALILIINHELSYQIFNQPPRDAFINQYNSWCQEGTWSAECINRFWGYSQVIRSGTALNDGSERLPPITQYVASLADEILDGTAAAADPALLHYGNALVDRSAQLLYQDFENGVYTYASYVVPTYCNGSSSCQNRPEDITGVFVVQTVAQNSLTGTLQDWIHP